eukprot:jgi/Mesen1/3865/ME000207S02874
MRLRSIVRVMAEAEGAASQSGKRASNETVAAAAAVSAADLKDKVGAGGAEELIGSNTNDQQKNTSWFSDLQKRFRWKPTSEEELLASERRLLTLLRSKFTLQRVDIGPGRAVSSKGGWFGTGSAEHRYINTLVVEHSSSAGPASPAEASSTESLASAKEPAESSPPGGSGGPEQSATTKEKQQQQAAGLEAGTGAGSGEAPTLVMVHGYGAAQGFFFRNLDALAQHFRVVTVDQLGWGGSSRPRYLAKNTAEAEAWFVDSLEEWRQAQGLPRFLLLGHSFGAYYPERVEHLLLVGPAGFAPESERMAQFRATWKGAAFNSIWQSNLTPMSLIRWGPNLVKGYTSTRFGSRSQGLTLSPDDGELCLKHIFGLGAFARDPLFKQAQEWKVPTTVIYGTSDWMDYRAGRDACRLMPVPAQVLRVPQGGHFVFLDNAPGFHDALLYACRKYIPSWRGGANDALPEGLIEVPLESGAEGEEEAAASSADEMPAKNRAETEAAKKWRFG